MWSSSCRFGIFFLSSSLAACGALQPGPSPIRPAQRTAEANRVAYVSVATTNVIRWEEIADDLNSPQFKPTPQELLNDAVQVTSSVNAQTTDALNAAVSAIFAGTSINRSTTTATDAAGSETTTASDQRSRQTPAAPDVNFNFAAPTAPGSGPEAVGTEAQLKYDIAKALAEEVAIKNREVASIAQRTHYRPYFVNMKVAVEPWTRLQPYDMVLDLNFLIAHSAAAKVPRGTQPIVVPLLVTDAMEETREAQTAQIVRQLGAALRASGGFAGASASLQRTLSRLDQTLAQRSNSLLTVAQYGTNGLRVRLGANAYGETYELISRTHSLSVILLVPVAVAESGESADRLMHVSGTLEYLDAGGPRLKSDPAKPEGVVTVFTDFEIPKRVQAQCPIPQDTLVEVDSPADNAPKHDSVTLSGADGMTGRIMQAEIIAPAANRGDAFHFVASNYLATAAGVLQFTFPEHSAFVGGAKGAPKTGLLSFTVVKDDDDQEKTCSAYRVIYPLPAPSQAKPAAGKKTGNAAAASGGSKSGGTAPPAAQPAPAAASVANSPPPPPAYTPPH
jgi:hypothetical protein